MKKAILLAAFILGGISTYAQSDDDNPAKDLNDAIKDINASNPLPISHQAIEKSTDENDAELNKSDNSSNNSNSQSSSSSSSDDPNKRKK